MTSALESLSKSPTSHKVGHILSNFLLEPIDKLEYFSYKGSLTTPGCNQAVIWTIMARVLPIKGKYVSNKLHQRIPIGVGVG